LRRDDDKAPQRFIYRLAEVCCCGLYGPLSAEHANRTVKTTNISAKCVKGSTISGITCTTVGIGPSVCDCSTGTCNPVAASTCHVGTGGISCVPGTAACTDSELAVDCRGTDSLFFREVEHFYCDTSVQFPASVTTWTATCSATDP
jgi:hypothetical protein